MRFMRRRPMGLFFRQGCDQIGQGGRQAIVGRY